MNVKSKAIISFTNSAHFTNISVAMSCLAFLIFPVWAAISACTRDYLRCREALSRAILTTISFDFIGCTHKFCPANFANTVNRIVTNMIVAFPPFLHTFSRAKRPIWISNKRYWFIEFFATLLADYRYSIFMRYVSTFARTCASCVTLTVIGDKHLAAYRATYLIKLCSTILRTEFYFVPHGWLNSKFVTAIFTEIIDMISGIFLSIYCGAFMTPNRGIDNWRIAIYASFISASIIVGFHTAIITRRQSYAI